MLKRLIARTRDQAGISLPEVMVAVMLLGIATTSGITALASTKHATVSADRSAAMTRAATSALEDLQKYDYTALGMKANVSASTANMSPLLNQTADAARFNFTDNTLKPGITGAPAEHIVDPAALDYDGVIDPAAPDTVTGLSSGSPFQMKVWKFVTWRPESCTPDGTIEVCDNDKDTKRLTVAVRPAVASAGHSNTVWLSSVVIDPSQSGAYVGGAGSTDGYDTQRFYLHDEPCTPTAVDVTTTYPTAHHAPHNTSHDATPGASNASYCDNTVAVNHPDALDTNGPVVSPHTVAQPDDLARVRYSASAAGTGASDIKWPYGPPAKFGYGGAGRAFQRSTGCPQAYSANTPPNNDPTAIAASGQESSWNVHTWASDKIDRPSGLTLRGRISLVLFAGSFGKGALNYTSNPGSDGTLCISVLDVPTSGTNPSIVYSFYCHVNSWAEGRATPGGPLPDGMAGSQMAGARRCRFNPTVGIKNVPAGVPAASAVTWPQDSTTPNNGVYNVAENHRLMLRISSCGANCNPTTPGGTPKPLVESADHPPVLFYDHENFPAEVDLATDIPWAG